MEPADSAGARDSTGGDGSGDDCGEVARGDSVGARESVGGDGSRGVGGGDVRFATASFASLLTY